MFNKHIIKTIGCLYLLCAAGSQAVELTVDEYLGTTGTGDNAVATFKVSVSVSGNDVTPGRRDHVCKGYPGASGLCSLRMQGSTCNNTYPQSVQLGPWEDRAGTKPVDYLNRNAGSYTATINTCGNKDNPDYGRMSLTMQLFTKQAFPSYFVLASTHGENGSTPIPPIQPPIEPLSCKIETVQGEFNFGTKSEHELPGAEQDLPVNIRCSGGDGSTASGKLTLKSASGDNKVDMKNSEGDVIPVQLIASKETGSNTLNFTAKDGYFVGHKVWSKILPFSISTYGTYNGNAIIDVTVD